MKRFALFFITTLFVSVLAIPQQPASAASGSDWRAGNIISDPMFTNPDDMSVADIQRFLDKRLSNCDVNGTGTSELGGGTRAQYGAAHSNRAPFTCLNNYYEVPKTSPSPGIPANNYGGKPIPAGAKSAAQIISDAAHAYNINPKVILVKIGTESAGPLTSDLWPFLKQYTYAMGSHCPDSGPGGSANCDTNYAGFSMQVYSGTELLRYYLDNMTQPWWPYKKPYQTNSVLWNVQQTGCGAGNVYIESKATAALYTYTPYQPNQAALNNMYGTGNGCSAYGNRNFWRTFVDWFGLNDLDFIPLDNPRWMELNKTSTKINFLNDTSDSGSITIGSQLRFVDKIFINNTWYLRSEWDAANNVPRGLPINSVSNIPVVPFETPRYLELNSPRQKWNPITEQGELSDVIEPSTVLKFTKKMTLNGQTYYQTEWDAANNIQRFITSSGVSNLSLNDFITPRILEINRSVSVIDLQKNTSVRNLEKGEQYKFSKKTNPINGEIYYQLDNDQLTSLAIPASSTSSINYVSMDTPRKMVLTKDETKVSPTTGKLGVTYPRGTIIDFDQKITVNNKVYLRSRYDSLHSNDFTLPLDSIENYTK